MAMLKLSETNAPEIWSKMLYDEKGFDIGGSQMDIIADTFFTGTSEILRDIKSKDYPVVFLYEDQNLEMIIAAIVRYIPNEDENMPGNWNYVWTFDKAEVPENARTIRLTDLDWHSHFRMAAGNRKFGFISPEAIITMGTYTMKAISQWLQDNAKEDEEMGVELEGVFQARAIVEDHEVYKSLEVIGETKAIIKDDAGSEV